MVYSTFVRLMDEAQSGNYMDSQEFIMSIGWQPWMDKEIDVTNNAVGDADEIVKKLEIIYELSRLDFKALRKRTGLSMAKMAAAYQIPLRTVENWDAGVNEITKYCLNLLKYTEFIREKEGDDGYIDFAE